MSIAARLSRLENTLMGLLYQHGQTRKRLEQHDEAILELAATLRRSGLSPSDGFGALSLRPSEPDPDRQNADAANTLPA